ncbi:hypothetical protein [Ciceribacter azotifigens]
MTAALSHPDRIALLAAAFARRRGLLRLILPNRIGQALRRRVQRRA